MQAAYRRRRKGGAHGGLRAHAAAHPRAEVALRPTAATGAVGTSEVGTNMQPLATSETFETSETCNLRQLGNSEQASPGWECVKPKQAETVP